MDRANEKLVSKRGFLKSVSLAIISTAALLTFPRSAGADVPDVLQIENISQDSMGKVRLEIKHANPNNNHYVDSAEVDVDGQITQFNLEPQNSNPFTVELELGEIQGTPDAKARAHCNLHGWSGWSDQIEIPEFPTPIIAIFAALAASLFMIRKAR
jgi:desulfoferrodoxin (superoxide reductase-like protein)